TPASRRMTAIARPFAPVADTSTRATVGDGRMTTGTVVTWPATTVAGTSAATWPSAVTRTVHSPGGTRSNAKAPPGPVVVTSGVSTMLTVAPDRPLPSGRGPVPVTAPAGSAARCSATDSTPPAATVTSNVCAAWPNEATCSVQVPGRNGTRNEPSPDRPW